MIRVLLVNEIQLTCHILAAVLDEEPDIGVVACASSAEEALDRVGDCDLALVSTDLDNNGSLELVRAIKAAAPATKVLMLGLAESEEHVLPYVQAGAFGYVLPDDSVDELLNRIRTASENRALVSPHIAAALISRLNDLSQLAAGESARLGTGLGAVLRGDDGTLSLTPREREILELIQRGLANQEIADELTIEVGTVKNHVHNILQKLDVGSREDAAAVASLMSGTPN